MSDWTELPGYPLTFASACAPWGSSVCFNGIQSETLRRQAFLQRLEEGREIGGGGAVTLMRIGRQV